MALPKRFPQDGGIQIACVYGQGGVSDQIQDPLQVCNMQVWSPTEHSWMGVQPNHIALSPQVRKTQSEFPRPPDPGSFVYCMKTTGRNDVVVLGQANEQVNPTTSTGGNLNLFMMNPYLMEAFMRILNMFPLPQYKETEKRGALIREVQEKNSQYFHGMLQGLPTEASLYPMAMITQQALKNIETAKQHFAAVMGNMSGLLSGMGGSPMSLGKMMNNMSNNQKNKVKQNMSNETQAALESLAYLLPNIEQSGGGYFATDALVNEDVFMSNAVDLLSQATSVSDITTILSRVQVDTSLYGLDQLKPMTVTVSGSFGNDEFTISANGDVQKANSNTNNSTSSSKSSFGSFMANPSASGGSSSVLGGQNMFGDSAQTIFDMMQRVFPQGESQSKTTVEETNKRNQAINRNQIKRKQSGDQGQPYRIADIVNYLLG